MSKERFNDLISIYQATTFEHGSRYGDLYIADELMRSRLQTAIDDRREYGISLCSGQVAVGNTVRLYTEDPRIGIGILADSFSEILSFPKGLIREPRFYLLDSNWCSLDNDNTPLLVSKYRLTIEFINLLSKCSAYFDTDNQELIFIHDGKFSIPVKYSHTDLAALDIDRLSFLLTRFTDDIHKEQKLAILAKSLQEMTGTIESKLRFEYILSNIDDLKKRLDDGYRLFVADFSYDKVVNQLESAKIEELTKIHKVLTDIQNQLLGIPLATIVVATQLKETSEFNLAMLTNTVVLFGVWVFSILCLFLIRNQQQTLDTINDEISRKQTLIEKDFPSVLDVISSTFIDLKKRVDRQNFVLSAVQIIIAIGFILSHIAYFCVTTYASHFLFSN